MTGTLPDRYALAQTQSITISRLDRYSLLSYYMTELTRSNIGFLLAKASQHWNELLYAGFCEEGYPQVRPSFGAILVPLFEEDGLRLGELARRARLSKQTM